MILLSLWNIIRDTFSSDEDGIQRFLKGINGWQMKCCCGFLWIIAYFIGILCLSLVAYLLLIFSAIFFTFCEWLIHHLPDNEDFNEIKKKWEKLDLKSWIKELDRMKLFEHFGESLPQVILSIVFIVNNGGIAANLVNSVSAAFSAGSLLFGIIKSCILWVKNDKEDNLCIIK